MVNNKNFNIGDKCIIISSPDDLTQWIGTIVEIIREPIPINVGSYKVVSINRIPNFFNLWYKNELIPLSKLSKRLYAK